MVCHIFSDIVRVPQFERPNPDAETPEEIVPAWNRSSSGSPQRVTPSAASPSRVMSDTPSTTPSLRIVEDASNITLEASEDLKKEVFVTMKNDHISKVARSDPLIVALGNLAMKRNIGNKDMRPYNVSSDMRLVARALIELRELQEGEDAQKNFTWYDGLHPDQYDNIVKAVFAVCRENFNEAEGEDDDDRDDLEAPSNAIKLSYNIARLCNVKITSCIVRDNIVLAEKTRKETKRFMEMFKYNWSTDVKKRARHVLRERKLNQKVELPDPNDIAILADHMKKRMEQSVRPETYDEFKELQYDTLARLIAFNRRRPGELQVMRYN